MIFKNYSLKKLSIKLIILLSFVLLTNCSVPKWAKPGKVSSSDPVNAKEKARKNIEEGKGVSLKGVIGGGRKTSYEFSTSNPLWRASLELIDFMPLTTVDYSGGIIITDWYTDGGSKNNESIKITIRFLSNEIGSSSLKIITHKKVCATSNNCQTKVLSPNSKINSELRSVILRKASLLEIENKKKKK
jgi:hypothetical protein